jgi:hypothetical protein
VSWWTTAPMLVACIAMMVVPGMVMAFCLGFRRVSAVALAPALTVGIAGVAAIVAPFVGLQWTLWTLGEFTIVASGAVLVLRRTLLRRWVSATSRPPGDRWPVILGAAAGVTIGGVIVARHTIGLIGNPQNIAQRFDNVFHLNAVRFIMENGNASTLNLGAVTGSTGRGAIYPATWHSFAALVADATGIGVAEAVNVVNVTVAAVVWPVSMVFLARVVAGARPVALLSTGILSAGFIAFPFLMMVWGPLFPYMLSVALLPAALGVVVLLVGMARDIEADRTMLVIALLIILAGIALSHMSSINALLVLTLPLLVWAAARKVRSLMRSGARLRSFLPIAVAAPVYIAFFLALWVLLRPGPYNDWLPHQTPGGAIGEAIANSPMGFEEVPVLVTVLGLAGLVAVVRSRRDAWLGVAFVLVVYLYVVDAAFDRSPLRTALTGIWYADTNRVAALLPLVSTLLGGLAVSAVWSALVRRIADLRAGAGAVSGTLPATRAVRFLGVSGAALLALVLGSGVQSSALETYLAESEQMYLRDWPESVLSSDEYTLLDRLEEEVPPDAVIAVNPWNGSSLAYAFTGREVTVYHLNGSNDPEVVAVSTALNRAPFSARACNAVRSTGVSFVLDFGDQFLAANPATSTYGGLEDLETSDAVELVDEQGAAKLYRVVVCQ